MCNIWSSSTFLYICGCTGVVVTELVCQWYMYVVLQDKMYESFDRNGFEKVLHVKWYFLSATYQLSVLVITINMPLEG